jgi:hypothetical protein
VAKSAPKGKPARKKPAKRSHEPGEVGGDALNRPLEMPGVGLGLADDAYPTEAPTFPEISEAKKRAYLVALCRTGRFGSAARAAGIDVRTAYNWRKADPLFEKFEDEAVEVAARLGEDEAWRRATQGVLEPVYQGGVLVGYKRVLSDTLLIFMLKGARPEKYRERVDMNHKGISANSPEGILLLMAGQPIPGSKPEGD